MASSALSSRRGPLRRPKVCHASPNPGRCHPLPVPVCSLVPAWQTITLPATAFVTLSACRPSVAVGADLDVDFEATEPLWHHVNETTNCDPGQFEFFPEGPGVTSHLHVTVTFPDSSVCQLQATVHVEPED